MREDCVFGESKHPYRGRIVILNDTVMDYFSMINMSVDDVLLNKVIDYSPSLLFAAVVIWLVWLISRKLLTYDFRLKSVEVRLDRVEARLDRVEERLDRVEARLDRVEARLDRIEIQMQEINHKLTELSSAVAALTVIVTGRFPPSPH